MQKTLNLGLVGLGKIARDQHLPSIARSKGVRLIAVASPNSQAQGVANYPSIESMLTTQLDLDAVVLCQPPQFRFDAARRALDAGKHVFLEKPPGATVSEVRILAELAARMGLTLFASWHARQAAGVAAAKAFMRAAALRSAEIIWREDVRLWHPGQSWLWRPGGLGVFDPGVNALSILTEILPEPIRVQSARFETPVNKNSPIAAKLELTSLFGAPIKATFDFRHAADQVWDIETTTDRGVLKLANGGGRLFLNGVEQALAATEEYPALYDYFVDLVRARRSDVDLAPLQLVADAFLTAQNVAVEPFYESRI